MFDLLCRATAQTLAILAITMVLVFVAALLVGAIAAVFRGSGS